jgi:primosomal protein N' (replication factor Y)
MCRECGWRALCPHCDLPLTLHEDSFELRCHTCGFKDKAPTSCPQCQNHEIIFIGPGTKAIEKEVRRLFPGARVARFDGDNLTSESLDKHLGSILDGSIDIIVGTQVLIKGFDIPRLGLVGLVDADTSLSFPDFATEENTYQLVNQAIGRVGRGHVDGTIVVQTLQPENPILTQAITKDWDTFYKLELQRRKEHDFPPFTFLLKLECARKSRSSASKAAETLKAKLESQGLPITILGPTPAFKEVNRDTYTWQLIIKSTRRSALLEVIKALPSGWKYDIDPTHLL